MSVQIRRAGVDDGADLAAFGRQSFFDTFGHCYPPYDAAYFSQTRFSLERTHKDLAEDGRVIHVAYQGDRCVGFLDCGRLGLPVPAPKENPLELYRLYVDQGMKGTGLAQTFMEMAIDWARETGANALYLGVYHDNGRAQAFYRKYGFQIVAAYQFKVGTTLDDERIMELILD
jgi:diamine N-acetyltransferase